MTYIYVCRKIRVQAVTGGGKYGIGVSTKLATVYACTNKITFSLKCNYAQLQASFHIILELSSSLTQHTAVVYIILSQQNTHQMSMTSIITPLGYTTPVIAYTFILQVETRKLASTCKPEVSIQGRHSISIDHYTTGGIRPSTDDGNS